MKIYLDASVSLRPLLNQPVLLAEWQQWDEAFTSDLFSVEARRTLDRLRVLGLLDEVALEAAERGLVRLERGIQRVSVGRSVLDRASRRMQTPCRTLDAIHIATALLLRERQVPDLIFATHDRQQATAARALGFEVVGAEAP